MGARGNNWLGYKSTKLKTIFRHQGLEYGIRINYNRYVIRKEQLVNGEVYHILNRSIAGYKIFNDELDYARMMDAVRIYQHSHPSMSISRLNKFPVLIRSQIYNDIISNRYDQIIQIIAHVLMPTHIHFVLKQLTDNGITSFMANISNSYARYFNISHKRSGHLWQGKFKNIRVSTDEHLLHLTRYIHLNPTSANLTKNPQDWIYSSYHEYLGKVKAENEICDYKELIKVSPKSYQKFVNDRVSYQKQLSQIKSLLLEDYTG